ncbi:hypothetical protein CF66_5012 [Candidatus Photodesmus katoptron]|uniref:OmpA-like transmembrane protein n=1 Tax=Candidatus Photodesmus katoptron Akat1 TaxID=1236703 RepID=S3DIB4_9GAMM|nr:outer membrane beta-barrel protein [Candidatus Photodesmus katoptron]EPE37450.1 OmpA-like transmembrane protein [Candidatus Photodesmus katoptron Akat1]KEY90219.1 hypothetical protein CF66_5012 [Candidatus Photodesmus katoptron]
MKKILALTLTSAVLSTSSAFADSWIYGGIGVGQAFVEDRNANTLHLSQKGPIYEAYVGTGILPFFGVEGGYIQHGKVTLINNVKEKIYSTYVALRPSLNFGPVQVFAKGGLHSWKQGDSMSRDLMYGIGVEYRVRETPISFGCQYMEYTFGKNTIMSNLALTTSFNIF